MPSIKRPSSAIEVTSTPNPWKKAKRTTAAVVKVENAADDMPSSSAEAVAGASDDEVADLKAQVLELQSFIMDQGLITKTTPSIRRGLELHPNAAEGLDKYIRDCINKARAKFDKEDLDFRSDYMSQELLQYLPEVVCLSHMPKGIKRAYYAMLHLGHSSFYTISDYSAQPDGRPSDKPADKVLMDILKIIKQENPCFFPGAEFEVLKTDVGCFAAHNNHQYFPMSFGLLLSWVEGPGAAQKYYERLKAEISAVNQKFEKELLAVRQHRHWDAAKVTQHSRFWSTVTTLSTSLEKFIPQIRRLGYMEDGLLCAFRLVLFLGRQSYPDLDLVKVKDTFQALDKPADELLIELAQNLKEEDQGFQPAMEVEMLKSETDYLAQHGITTYFPQALKLLSSWVPNAAKAYAQESHDKIKAQITEAHTTIEKRYAQYKYDEKRPTSDWLSSAMKEFVPQIEELSEKPDGLKLAIDLILYLGKCSYTKMEDWQRILDPIHGRPAQEYLDPESETFMNGINFGPRPSDDPADTLLFELLQKAKNEGIETEGYEPALEGPMSYLLMFGIDSYFISAWSYLCGVSVVISKRRQPISH